MSRQPRRSSPGRKKSVPGRGASALFKRSPLIWFLFISGGLIVAVLFIAIPSNTLPIADHTDPKLVELGRRIYAAQCASCHGANLEGQPNWQARSANEKLPAPPHDASGHTWHHADQALFDITKRGPAAYRTGYLTDMPAFGDRLSDEEIAAVLAFIKSTWPAEILRRQPKARN